MYNGQHKSNSGRNIYISNVDSERRSIKGEPQAHSAERLFLPQLMNLLTLLLSHSDSDFKPLTVRLVAEMCANTSNRMKHDG